MKKLLCFIILIAVLSTTLLSCDNTKDESEAASETASGDHKGYKDEDGKYVSKLEVKDWEQREFSIIVRGERAGTYQSEDFTTESTLYGDLLNDAVSARNNNIEEKYNVKLKVYKSDTINQDIRNDINGDMGAYDVVMPTLATCAQYAQSKYFYDLNSIENMDLDAPWWDENANKSFSVGGNLYFTTGDITILNKVCTPSILFNKNMIDEYSLDNPYELVRDNEWTFDKMVEMAKEVTAVNVPDDIASTDNVYGMLAANDTALLLYGAAGETLCGKNSDDYPYLSLGSERSIKIGQELLSTLSEGEWCVFADEFEEPIWVTSFAPFLEGRILFRPSGFSATTKARQQSDLNFGILPTPLWEKSQSDYYSYCGTGEVAGLAIPVSCEDKEFSAYMADIYAAEAKNTITPAYYEVNLKGRDIRDDESLEMLDIIFDNIVYDVGEVYNFGTLKNMFIGLLKDRSSDIVSEFDAVKESAEYDISETIDKYKNQ